MPTTQNWLILDSSSRGVSISFPVYIDVSTLYIISESCSCIDVRVPVCVVTSESRDLRIGIEPL